MRRLLISLGDAIVNLTYVSIIEIERGDDGSISLLRLTISRFGNLDFHGEEARRSYDLLRPYFLGSVDGSTRAASSM